MNFRQKKERHHEEKQTKRRTNHPDSAEGRSGQSVEGLFQADRLFFDGGENVFAEVSSAVTI
ncbi:MAG: hypothetical protein ABI254_00680, partial [Chthoniobacterales bacterium]